MVRSFHLDDVPAALVDADVAAAIAVPAGLAIGALGRAARAQEAARIAVPVFVGAGERDTTPDLMAEAGAYTASSDITLFRLPGSAHAHNYAATRTVLWDRLIGWIGAL
jgi:pimeloyl-ACP methyl ester carboxylesterase